MPNLLPQKTRRGYGKRGRVLRRLQKRQVERMVRLDGGGASMPRLRLPTTTRSCEDRLSFFATSLLRFSIVVNALLPFASHTRLFFALLCRLVALRPPMRRRAVSRV